MKNIRLATLVFPTILAISLIVVSVASAIPSFSPAEGQFLARSTVTTIKAGPDKILCAKDISSGEVIASMELGHITLHLLECDTVPEGGEKPCTVKSEGAPSEGLIITRTLHGILGLILPSKAVGLLLLPSSGKAFVNLEGNACISGGLLLGLLAGLLSPVGVSQTTGKLIFSASGSNQEIREIDTLGGLREPELSLGFAATLEAEESIVWSRKVEVT